MESVRNDLDAGKTLPASWYTDEAVYAEEMRRIFHRTWQYAGHIEEVAEPGAFFTYRAGDVPVVVVRGEDGALNAFANVCRHRGSELVLERAGRRRSLQCHYHAWTYGLDGRLRAAPRTKDDPAFDAAEHRLVPLPVDTWGPFVFVNPDRDAEPLASFLGDLPGAVAASGLDLGRVRFVERREWRIRANWKINSENYLECYHCPVSHPGFRDVIDLDNYEITEHGHYVTQRAPSSAEPGTVQAVREGLYNFLWPNLAIGTHPGPHNVIASAWVPVAVDETLAVFDFFFDAETSADDARAVIDFTCTVEDEDVVLCESVQRGLRSGFFHQGRFVLREEAAIRHFDRLVDGALTA